MHATGLLSGLILAYVERACGRPGVHSLLEHAGMAGREAQLRDEDSSFSFDTKVALWDAAVAVTGDPDVAQRAGEAGFELTVGVRLKQAMRALGSPELLLRNIARVSHKFNWSHSLELIERRPCWTRLAYRDLAGVGYTAYDCQCTIGLLRMVPPLFGLPHARVTHPLCGVRGDSHCEFEVTWTPDPRRIRRTAVAGGALATGLTVAGAAIAPSLLAAGAVIGGATACLAGTRAAIFVRRRIRALETQVRELGAESEAQLHSLALLSSELKLDKALERIAETARITIGGAQFALLVAEADGMSPRAHSGIPQQSLARLARWADDRAEQLRHGPAMLDDLAADPELAPLASDPQMALGSACAAGLINGERLLGVLIALAPGPTVFFPKDVRSLEIYAGHAATALFNARLVAQLELHAAEDSLTGLANRRAFDAARVAELHRIERHGGSAGLIVFDLDHFKQINDSYGHPCGDRILVQVAAVLRDTVRAHDTVARLGGEEFAVLLPGSTLQEAQEIAERARERLSRIELPNGWLSCSAGVAVADGTADGVGRDIDLFAAADRAMYAAKRQGRGRTVLSPD